MGAPCHECPVRGSCPWGRQRLDCLSAALWVQPASLRGRASPLVQPVETEGPCAPPRGAEGGRTASAEGPCAPHCCSQPQGPCAPTGRICHNAAVCPHWMHLSHYCSVPPLDTYPHRMHVSMVLCLNWMHAPMERMHWMHAPMGL